MNKILIILLLACSCKKSNVNINNTSYNKIEIIFDGNSDQFRSSEKLKITVNDTLNIQKINDLKNNSKLILFGSRKGTDYIITIYFTDTNSDEKLTIRIFKSIDLNPVVVYGLGTIFERSYRNNEFVDYIGSIIRLDSIANYSGELSQEYYEKNILEPN